MDASTYGIITVSRVWKLIINNKEKVKMKSFVVAVVTVALLAIPLAAWAAEDGAALFKAKCAVCHGAAGEGKAATKIPAIKGTALTADKIAEYVLKGAEGKKAPHTKPVAGITAEQAKAIADFAKTLK
jgi:cytochrome c